MTSALATARPDEVEAPVRRVTLRPAPLREPPYDDELVGSDIVPIGRHDRPLPLVVSRPKPAPLPREMSPLRASVPDPAEWTRRLLVGVIETAAGRRPLQQLAALVSRSVAYGLAADFDRAARSGRRHWIGAAGMRSVRATEPADGVAEVSATLRCGTRVRAAAVRLEIRHGRWCCTRLVLG